MAIEVFHVLAQPREDRWQQSIFTLSSPTAGDTEDQNVVQVTELYLPPNAVLFAIQLAHLCMFALSAFFTMVTLGRLIGRLVKRLTKGIPMTLMRTHRSQTDPQAATPKVALRHLSSPFCYVFSS